MNTQDMRADRQTHTGCPLTNIKVLDLSRVLAGPWATQCMADLGAEVLKIERPGEGDDTRKWGPPFITDPKTGTMFSAYYLATNRSKSSVGIDFSQPEGAELIRRLAAEADIVVENFKVGTLKRYGLDFETLHQINPRLVYCSITGFGQSGPYANRGGYDFLIQAMGGLMSVTGPDAASPTKVGVPVIDLFCGLYATISVLAALRDRDQSGQGQHIDCSLMDTSVAILANQAMNYLVSDRVPEPMGNSHPNVVPYQPFEAADGGIIITVGNQRQYTKLCQILGREDLLTDPRYADNDARLARRAEIEAILNAEIGKWARADLLARMDELGVPGGALNDISDVFDDPHVQARGLLSRTQGDQDLQFPYIRYPAVFSRSRIRPAAAAPALGADTDAGLGRWLNLTAEELAQLRGKGILPADT